MSESCETCRFLRSIEHVQMIPTRMLGEAFLDGTAVMQPMRYRTQHCLRYPEPLRINDGNHWCGEYQPKPTPPKTEQR